MGVPAVGESGFNWIELSQFWHPLARGEVPVVMVNVYCDESHDDHTYTLAGWIGSPTGWDHFIPAWRGMLNEFPVPYFHASDLENKERDKNSRYKDFSRADVVRFFTRATDVVCDKKNGCAWMEPVGCSISLADHGRWTATPDTPWKLLFAGLLLTIFNRFPAQNGFSFMFDEKESVKSYVDRFYKPAKDAINAVVPGKIHGAVVEFGDDEEPGLEPLQGADLLAYEWRKRVSHGVVAPGKDPRPPWKRIRETRPDGVLNHYDASAVDIIMEKMRRGTHFVTAMLECEPTAY